MWDFDLRKLLKRYSPDWFRWDENQSFAYALAKWTLTIWNDLMGQRAVVGLQYRYNGLKHSMEWMLNDYFDPVQRRIYITVQEQLPVLYYQDAAEPPVAYLDDPGGYAAFYCLDEAELNTASQYTYEFLVNVPVSIGFNNAKMFALLDLYRYAGRRPAIRRFDTSENTISIVLHG